MTIRILLADDHKMVLDGLRTLIEKQPDMEVVAEARTGRAAVKLAGKLTPDVVVLDISMPDMNGIDATRKVISEVPGTKVVALSMHSDQRFVCGMLEAGASGYLLKDCAFDELAAAIRTVVRNQTYLSPKIAHIVVDNVLKKPASQTSTVFQAITHREREVMQLLSEGMSTKEIAAHLKVSVKTVETHRHNIMCKLNIESMAELVKYAIREGLTTIDK